MNRRNLLKLFGIGLPAIAIGNKILGIQSTLALSPTVIDDAFIPEIWAQESLTVLQENMICGSLVHHDYENHRYYRSRSVRQPRFMIRTHDNNWRSFDCDDIEIKEHNNTTFDLKIIGLSGYRELKTIGWLIEERKLTDIKLIVPGKIISYDLSGWSESSENTPDKSVELLSGKYHKIKVTER